MLGVQQEDCIFGRAAGQNQVVIYCLCLEETISNIAQALFYNPRGRVACGMMITGVYMIHSGAEKHGSSVFATLKTIGGIWLALTGCAIARNRYDTYMEENRNYFLKLLDLCSQGLTSLRNACTG